jgi:hypothetical protein
MKGVKLPIYKKLTIYTRNTKYNKKIQVILAARLHTSKFQLNLCFNIDLKELKDSAIFASWGLLFQCKAPL